MKVGVLGGSGYAGAELLRLCAAHPEFDVAVVTAGRQVGIPVGSYIPSLAAAYPGMAFEAGEPGRVDGLDLVFSALPHGESQRLVPALVDRVGAVVDLAADFRLRDPALYPRWYGEAHDAPALLAEAVYGLPELSRDGLAGAHLVAAAGCYPTAAALALAPFTRSGAVERSGIVVDAASGVSGAGRGLADHLHFGAVDESVRAYGLLDHRHTPEIEQSLGASVIFTPHLVPMTRGILATCYARPAGTTLRSTAGALALLREAYAGEPFVIVTEESPATKDTTGSNSAHLTARVDDRTGWLLVLCALDNLVKGAAGQAIQCANLVVGRPETLGLPRAGLTP